MKLTLVAALVLLSGAAATTAHANDRLPKEMLGAWATDLEACKETASEIKITVEPKIILYYEVSQSVRKITKQKDGYLRVSGHSADLDGKSPSTIDIKLDGDKLIFGKQDGQTYFRCPKDSPK